MSRLKTRNTFHGGMNTDMPDYQTSKDVYTYAENVSFVTHEGNEMILQSEKGTTNVAFLKENYIPIACKSYGQIAYIISAEVINDKFTGRGEIGTYPSPDYDNFTEVDCFSGTCNKTGNLIDEYRPLKNYLGDGADIDLATKDDYINDFNSIHFNFKQDKPVKIVALQPSYDESINIIFTDNFNKPKLVNTRFTVLPDNKYIILDRSNADDDNLYNEDNFNNTLNHIITSDKLLNIEYNGQDNNGSLPSGNYKYFFRYQTQDGNLTDVVGESFMTSVFFGNTVQNTRGGIKNEKTIKSNKFTLYNVDTAYAYIKIYFSYSYGLSGSDAFVDTFEIDNPIQITSDSIEFTHNGYESVTPYLTENLSLNYSSVDTYKTGCELMGRLFIANIKTKDYNYNELREFASKIKIGHKEKSLHVIGADASKTHSQIYVPISYNNQIADGWEGAYYNPKNIHDRLGYWAGESYMFGVVYLFKDGSQSPVFPIRGIDNLNNEYSTDTYPNLDFFDPAFDDLDDFTTFNGENIRGVYRFPKRGKVKLPLSTGNSVQETIDVVGSGIRTDIVTDAFTEFPPSPICPCEDITDCSGYFVDTDGDGLPDPGTPAYINSQYYTEEETYLLCQGYSRDSVVSNGDGTYTVEYIKYNEVDEKGNPYGTTYVSTVLSSSNQFINPLCVTFDVPLPTESIRNNTLGIMFVRSNRKKDCVSQGYMFDTLMIPLNEYTQRGKDTKATKFWDYNSPDIGGFGYTETNSKVIPAYDFMLESTGRYGARGNNNQLGRGNKLAEYAGIELVKFNNRNVTASVGYTQGTDLDTPYDHYYNKKFSFISPDIFCDKIDAIQNLSGSEFYLDPIAKCNSIFSIPTKNVYRREENPIPYGFSLIKTIEHNDIDEDDYPSRSVKLDWVQGFSELATENRFSSKSYFHALLTSDYTFEVGGTAFIDFDDYKKRDIFYGLFPLTFNDYVGITLNEGTYNIGSRSTQVRQSGEFLDRNNNFTYQTTKTTDASLLVNVYKGGSIRDISVIKEISRPEYEQYFPVTKPMYWDSITAESVNASEYVTVLDSQVDGVIEAWNGDNFIGISYRRLFVNSNDTDVVDGDKARDINIGYSLSLCTESNYNSAFRNTQIVDINEGRERTFLPFTAKDTDPGDIEGNNNEWRDDRLLETEEYSTGYNDIKSAKIYIALSANLPFIQTNFNTRIMYSDSYVSSSFENGYRFFMPLSRQDYSKKLGQITEIYPLNNSILCVHEYGITHIPVSQRIAQIGDDASSVFFESVGVLPSKDNIRYVSEKFGSKWQFSVCLTDNYVYGVDVDKNKIWRTSGGALELISDYQVQKLLKDIRDNYIDKDYNWLSKQIRTYFDPFLSQVMFTFISSVNDGLICGEYEEVIEGSCPTFNIDNDVIFIEGGDTSYINNYPKLCYNNDHMLNLTYSEVRGKWKTTNSYYPVNMFSIYNNLFSFNLKNLTNNIHKHYSNILNTNYYDEQHKFVIEFVATSSTEIHQIFNNLFIIQNHIYPEKIEYTTDSGTYEQTIYPRSVVDIGGGQFKQLPANDIGVYNASYKEDHMYITITKDIDDNYSIGEFYNRLIRDKYCRIRITYNTSEKIIIQLIDTIVTKSNS